MLRGQAKKDYQKKYMERQRSNKSVEPGDVRPFKKEALATLDPHKYPAIIYVLTDPVKRLKLEKITLSLKNFKQSENVRYGVNGPSFDVVGELLDATK